MTNLTFPEAAPLVSELDTRIAKLRPSPVFFYPYLKRVLAEQWEKQAPKFPMEIRIPKANKYLLKGDYEPEKVIVLKEPIRMEDGTPMWFERSDTECWLRFGYTNCDARYVCNQKLDMEYIHGFLGGSSGHGKSVTLNAMMGALFYEYAPWELEINLSDAKIIEFKKYGVGHRIPHIRAIAATEDADFVISVLQRAYNEMNQRAKIFGNLGVSNLKSFRKKTGLAYPRVIVVMDEVESTFKLAGRKAGKIANLIDGFSRLGRAAGYHLVLATQNMSSDIPKSAVGQIRVRMCLGANQTTSEAVLGNGGACDNFGRIGKLIVNTEVLNGGDTYPANVEYQTPFLEDDKFEFEMQELESIGAKVGYAQVMSFYDEADVKTLEQYRPIMDQVLARMGKDLTDARSGNTILLGFPSFVTEDPDGLLKVSFDHRDVENMCICSTNTERMAAHIHNIAYCLRSNWGIFHFATDADMLSYTPTAAAKQEVRDATQPPLTQLDSLVRRRLFLIYLDSIAASDRGITYSNDAIEKIFAENNIPKEHWGNSLMLRRAALFSHVQAHPDNYKSVWPSVAGFFTNFAKYYGECVKYKSIIEPITPDKFSQVLYFVGDLSKIVGWGRDTNGKLVTALKKWLQDCNRAGIVAVLYTRSLDGMNELQSGIRYGIFDVPDTRDWGRLRTESPGVVGDKLAVLYDAMDTQDSQKKFKRTLLREEF